MSPSNGRGFWWVWAVSFLAYVGLGFALTRLWNVHDMAWVVLAVLWVVAANLIIRHLSKAGRPGER